MIRAIYTAKRAVGMSHEGFVRRWRLHGGRSMAATQFWQSIDHYIHGDAILDSAAFPGLTVDVDGVGDIWWKDEDAFRATMEAQDAADVLADGAETFDQANMLNIVGTDVAVLTSEVTPSIGVWIFHRLGDLAASGGADWPMALLNEVGKGPVTSINTGRSFDRSSHYDLYMELGFTALEAAAAVVSAIAVLTDSEMNVAGLAGQSTIVPVWRRVQYDRAQSLGCLVR